MKIRPVGAELFHTDGRTDMKLIVAFRNFANTPKQAKQISEATNKDVTYTTEHYKRQTQVKYI